MFKTNEEIIIIQAKATTPIPTGVVFWSHDKGTAKMLFQLQKDYVNQTLSEGTIVPICLDFVGGRHIYHAVIEDAINGIVSIVLEDNILGYVGRVTGSIYIELPDSRSLDTAGRFTFDIKRSPIDLNTPELEDYYWQGFNEIIDEYHQTINTIKSEAKALIDSLTADVTTAQSKITQLEQSITTANTNLNARIDEINKKIDDNDVFTKAKSSANVIDTIGGATSTIFKDEMLVNGVEAVASRNNNGTLEPFSQADYDDLDNSDKYVRSETLLNGRGAAIDCEFPVIEILEKRHPWMFKNTSTLTEKIQTYLSYNPTFKIPFAARGRGILTSNNVESSRSMMHQKRKNGSWIGVASGTSTNITSNFVTYGNEGWGKTHFDEVLSDGNYTFRVCSKNNDITAAGCISDGVTPAWVELRDIKLIVEFEANGRTVVESIVAANHVENLATQEEAEAGTDNTKIMTPLRTREVIDKQAVSIAGNQTIGGIKNFQNEPLVDGSPVGLINDACWCEDFAVNSLAAGKVNPDLQRFTTSNENIFSASGKTITIHEAGIYLMALGVSYTGLTSWVSIGISRTDGTSLVNRNLIEASTSGSNSFTYVRSFAGNDELVIEINSGKAGITMQKINLAIVKLA